MYTESDLIQLSALQHFVFCPRQCALIHIEQVWIENQFTAEGKIMHENADSQKNEFRDGVKIERGMPLRSLTLGLSGKADVVEFYKSGNTLVPFPVEYKRGKPKTDNSDKVQLCAQALCLEEMLNLEIPRGALFYGKTRRRLDVEFDEALRGETRDIAKRLHAFVEKAITPKADYSDKCKACSLLDICMPKMMSRKGSVKEYLAEGIKET